MKDLIRKLKYQRSIKSYSINIIVISSFGFVWALLGIIWFFVKLDSPYMNLPETDIHSIANLFNPKYYLIQSIFMIAIAALLIISSYNVLKYSARWKRVLQYALVAQIVFLIVAPILNIDRIPNLDTNMEIWGPAKTKIAIWSVEVSYLIAVYYLFALLKFSQEGVKRLFK